MCVHPSIGRLTSILVVCAAVAATARCQTTLFTLNGPGTSEFGASVARVGDVDLDGQGDFIVGAPGRLSSGFQTGAAYVYSGTGSLLLTIPGDPGANDRLGTSVAGAGDVDGDGRPDLIVGVPYDDTNGNTNNGTVRVYSGADGALLRTFHGDGDWDRHGWSVDGPGDVNGDGRGDVIAGVNRYAYPGLGYAKVYSGGTGAVLYDWSGPTDGSLFGWSVSGTGDVNLDGRPDLIVGAAIDDTAGPSVGSARVYSGATGLPLHTLFGPYSDSLFGWGVSDGGDLNGDGRPDVIVGCIGCGGISGAAYAYSGDGTLLWSYAGAGQAGWSLSGAGDVDADGRGDVVVGEPLATQSGNTTGRITVISGATGLALFSAFPPAAGGNAFFGTSVDGPADLDVDLRPDFLAGGPAYDLPGTDHGIVRAYGADPFMVSSCEPGSGGVVACPCGNPPTGPDKGCNNFAAFSGGAAISASGARSLSADSVVLTSSGENSTAFTVFWSGRDPLNPTGVVHGAGVRCVAATLRRIYIGAASGGAFSRPGPGDDSVSERAIAVGDPISPGQARHYFAIYRDPAAAGPCGASSSTINLSNAGTTVWLP